MKAYQYIPVFILMAVATFSLTAQTANQNYIKVKSMRNDTGTEFLESIQYFDGLGRPIQAVMKGITPGKQDLVTFQEYDGFGRESKSWLPSMATGNNGAFVSLDNVKAKALATYADSAYSRPVYEASPLGRVLEQYGPGKEWYNNKKAVKTSYLANLNSIGNLVCAQFEIVDNVKLKKVKLYDNNQIYVTEMTDEDGNISYEFKNKSGQVVKTSQIYNSSHTTYYVYDDFGNLCFVLPPLAADALTATNVVWTEATQAIKDYAYLYQYDASNRCIKKKLPGCDWVKFVYDKADRLIFSQDGEQSKKGEWLFNKYDGLGRVILSGVYKTTESHEVLIAKCKDIVVKEEPVLGSPYPAYGYTWNTLSGVTFEGVLTVNHYDNYDYVPMLFPNLAYEKKTGYDKLYLNPGLSEKDKGYSAKGLLVATRTKLLNDSENREIVTTMFYDERGRVIQSKSTNHLGGTDSEYIAYNFTGQPTSKLSIHTATNKPTQTELYTYTYDHAGRLTETKHKLNTNAEISLTKNEYDDLGRLKKTTANGQANLVTSYAYNIRSWTKKISNPLFTQELFYNEDLPNITKAYNGNISALNWISGQGSTTKNWYAFNYDQLSRLLSGSYNIGQNYEFNNNNNNLIAFNEDLSYDKHGNITSLTRHGASIRATRSTVDDLRFFTYKGNQVIKVNGIPDTNTHPSSIHFSDFANKDIEYVYNANGAITQDLNKGISSIQYNSLNLPYLMEIKSPVAEARNEYLYSASGAKLRVTQKWNPNYPTSPVIGSSVNTALLTKTKTTDYIGNKVYEDGALKRILVSNGYVENNGYYFYIKDHLGNNRIVADASGKVVQRTDYYPFGTPIFAGEGQAEQPYKYNGKEFDTMHGLNQYDYHARFYDSTLPRFTTMDPLAEKYYSISPYVYCNNNPLRFIDPTGMSFGDFLDDKGNVIGNDGISDERLYVMKTDASKESKKYIKENSGNSNAFKDPDNTAYQNSIEIECNPTARQDMVNEVNKDNGKGGTKDANNREYGGSIENGVVTVVAPGAVANPLANEEAQILLPAGKATFHSHPSGDITITSAPSSNVLGGGTTTSGWFEQPPSKRDVTNAGTFTNYVFGRGDKKTYIYNANGTQAIIPTRYFVTPKK